MVRLYTDEIIIHHSLSPDVSAAVIDCWHRERGWTCIGYHIVIRKNGTFETGRNISYVGAHAKGRNAHSIGICLPGDFFKYAPSEEQLRTLKTAVALLLHVYPEVKYISPHRSGSVPCPGPLFNVDEWVETNFGKKYVKS